MSVWNKKPISKSQIEELQNKYNVDPLTASIMVRRNVTEGKDILYYMEDDLRFQHSPFSFSAMEDAVDRILDAIEEKEKVLIFGDRDVDGVTSTTILFDCLSSMGVDVQYRLPGGDDAYGLSMAAVDEFAAEYGSLIITVDCGISNINEIAHAGELGLDVIVVDHHNPPENLPAPAIIIDPKTEDSGYPFHDISGAAVVYKLVSAIRFSRSKWYKEEVTLLNARTQEQSIVVECVKLRNLVPVSKLEETIIPGTISLMNTRLPNYLQGQAILVWDEAQVRNLLIQAFGNGTDFNLFDIRPEISRLFASMSQMPLSRLKELSKIAKYGNHAATEIGGFYNIYVTYVQATLKKEYPSFQQQEEKDLQLVGLAALADIMPMKDENRLFVKKGLASINSGKVRPGLIELMSKLNLLGKKVNSTDLSWIVVSHLNAAGRLGHPELAADLFLCKNPQERDSIAQQILDLNTERKKLSTDAWSYGAIQAETSIPNHNSKLCVVIDERINRGVSGILAGRLVSKYDVPAMAVTFVDKIAIGSMRSCRGYDVTGFLDQMGDIFLNHGGHNFAAGFSFNRERLPEFEQKVKELSATIELSQSESDTYNIDAEIPASYMTPKLLELEDRFEPFGEENPQLLLLAKNLPVIDAMVMGKGEKQHLKVIVNAGNTKWPCLFWNEGERLHRDFEVGDKIDMLFHVERNTFNGVETPQIVITDMKKSS